MYAGAKGFIWAWPEEHAMAVLDGRVLEYTNTKCFISESEVQNVL